MTAPLWRRVASSSATAAAATLADRRRRACSSIVGLVFGGLWWRLGSGPIEFDMATPWLTAAIEDNFGENYKVQVGGTQIERDGGGRIRLRLRDIMVRDAEGAIAASAPKAEVGFSSKTLLTGRVRAERLALVGAEMSVRIEPGGNVTRLRRLRQAPDRNGVGAAAPPAGRRSARRARSACRFPSSRPRPRAASKI